MKLNFCGRVMLMPERMDKPGTMLIDDRPCPTHQIVDEPRGYSVRMGLNFWSVALEALSSRPVRSSAKENEDGAPAPTRTGDRLLRRQMLYPPELRAHRFHRSEASDLLASIGFISYACNGTFDTACVQLIEKIHNRARA